MAHLETLTKIKMLFLLGNPLYLSKKYKEIIKQRFEDLLILDGKPAFTEAEENAKKKLRKKMAAMKKLNYGM